MLSSHQQQPGSEGSPSGCPRVASAAPRFPQYPLQWVPPQWRAVADRAEGPSPGHLLQPRESGGRIRVILGHGLLALLALPLLPSVLPY